MENNSFSTPILFIIFNRPDTTKEVFNQIKRVKPKNLFLAADGPRMEKPGELEKCKETRDIVNQVNWDCNINTLFQENNLGCREAVSTAISWFFKNVEYGIILEDDCYPDISFFHFCDNLLEKYQNNTKIYHINGCNFLYDKKYIKDSYYFSRYPVIWGWATWRRAWGQYDILMKDFPEFKKKNVIDNILPSRKQRKHFNNAFESMYLKKHNSWSAQWLFTVMKNDGLAITPDSNLIINIGTQTDSTHRFLKDSKRTPTNLVPLVFPLKHPNQKIEEKADTETYNILWGKSFSKIFRLLKENSFRSIFIYTLKRLLNNH